MHTGAIKVFMPPPRSLSLLCSLSHDHDKGERGEEEDDDNDDSNEDATGRNVQGSSSKLSVQVNVKQVTLMSHRLEGPVAATAAAASLTRTIVR